MSVRVSVRGAAQALVAVLRDLFFVLLETNTGILKCLSNFVDESTHDLHYHKIVEGEI